MEQHIGGAVYRIHGMGDYVRQTCSAIYEQQQTPSFAPSTADSHILVIDLHLQVFIAGQRVASGF
jgi:hypothetical protein